MFDNYNDLVSNIYTQILPQNNNVTTFVSFGTGCIFCMTCYSWHFSTITSAKHLKLKLSYQNSHRGENFAWRGRNVYELLTIHETHQGTPINSCNNKTLFMKNGEFNNIIKVLYHVEQTGKTHLLLEKDSLIYQFFRKSHAMLQMHVVIHTSMY